MDDKKETIKTTRIAIVFLVLFLIAAAGVFAIYPEICMAATKIAFR